jgi:uncharacterized protein (TIGR03067 family)
MRHSILFTCFALALASAFGCGSKNDATATSEPDSKIDNPSAAVSKKIEGSYTVVEMLVGGMQDMRGVETKSFLIKDGKMVIERGAAKRVMMFSLDPSSQPGHIDITYPSDNKTTKGIYDIKENENGVQVRLAFPEDVDENVRPNDFSGTTGVLIVLSRKKTW